MKILFLSWSLLVILYTKPGNQISSSGFPVVLKKHMYHQRISNVNQFLYLNCSSYNETCCICIDSATDGGKILALLQLINSSTGCQSVKAKVNVHNCLSNVQSTNPQRCVLTSAESIDSNGHLYLLESLRKTAEYAKGNERDFTLKKENKNAQKRRENTMKCKIYFFPQQIICDILEENSCAANLTLKLFSGTDCKSPDKTHRSPGLNDKVQIVHSPSAVSRHSIVDRQEVPYQSKAFHIYLTKCTLNTSNVKKERKHESKSRDKQDNYSLLSNETHNLSSNYFTEGKFDKLNNYVKQRNLHKNYGINNKSSKTAMKSQIMVKDEISCKFREKPRNIWNTFTKLNKGKRLNSTSGEKKPSRDTDYSNMHIVQTRAEEFQTKLDYRTRARRHVTEDAWKAVMKLVSLNRSKVYSLGYSEPHFNETQTDKPAANTGLLALIVSKLTPSLHDRIAASARSKQGTTMGVLENNTQHLTDSSVSEEENSSAIITSSEGSGGGVDEHDNRTQNSDGVSETTSTPTNPVLPSPEPENDGIMENCQIPCFGQGLYNDSWIACPGEMSTQNCPSDDALGNATWKCGINSTFIGFLPNYEQCIHLWIFKVIDKLLSGSDPLEVAEMMQYYANSTEFFGNELERTLDILNFTFGLHERQVSSDIDAGLREKLSRSTNFTELSTAVVDNLLEAKQGIIQLHEKKRMSLGIMVTTLSMCVGFSLAEVAAKLPGYVKYNATFRENGAMVFGVEVLDKGGSVVQFPPADNSSRQSYIVVNANLSSQTVNRPRSVGMILAPDTASLLFPPSRNSFGCSSKILNSVLISMSVQDTDDEDRGGTPRPLEQFLSPPNENIAPVTVTLRHLVRAGEPRQNVIWRDKHPGERPTAVLGSARCVFWNGAQWDDSGCKVQNTDEHETVCACTHLSTFAVLMDVHDYVGKDQTLELLSWTCSGASVICLLFTLLIFQGCRSIQSERTSIGKNLCTCLLMSHVITLIFLDKSYFNLSNVACSVIAGLLHYLLLASFCWMAIEGHHLYRMVIRVFHSGLDLRRRYLTVGYGLPAIIVGLTKILALLRQERAYGRDELCWLSSPMYIWSFIGPVLLLTTINTAVLIVALRAAVVSGLSQGKTKGETVWVWIRGWFSLSALLGVTWLFGLAYMEFNQSFMYIFVVLNGCQGVFIFLFRCVLSEQVRSSILPRVKHLASGLKQPRRWSWTVESPLGTSRTPSIVVDSTEYLHDEACRPSESKTEEVRSEREANNDGDIWTTGQKWSPEGSPWEIEEDLATWTALGLHFPSPKMIILSTPAQPTIPEESDPDNY